MVGDSICPSCTITQLQGARGVCALRALVIGVTVILLTVGYLLSHTPLNFALAIIQSATGRQKVLYNLY